MMESDSYKDRKKLEQRRKETEIKIASNPDGDAKRQR